MAHIPDQEGVSEQDVGSESQPKEAGGEAMKRLTELGLDEQTINALLELFASLEKQPAKLRKYIKTALRLRELERETGKSFTVLLREYDKKFKESVKLEYAISELKAKREKIEEDLKIYMEQQKLTLDKVNKASNLFKLLESHGISTQDLELLVSAAKQLKEIGGDPAKLLEMLDARKSLLSEIEELESRKKSLEEELAAIESSKKEKEEQIAALIDAEPEFNSIMEARSRLKAEVEQLEDRVNELNSKIEELTREYESLYGYRGKAEEIENEIRQKQELLASLDEEISKKEEQVKILEEEVDAARSLLNLMQNPEIVPNEEIETLAHQLLNIVKVRKGELPALRPLEQSLTENARKRIVELILPAIRSELVPKWVFDKLEKEFKALAEKRVALEAELAELRKLYTEQRQERPPPPAQEATQEAVEKTETRPAVAFFKRLSTKQELTNTIEKKARVKCPHCGEGTIVMLPVREDLEEAAEAGDKIVLECSSCRRDIQLNPATLLRYY